jgi:hypothetical protein
MAGPFTVTPDLSQQQQSQQQNMSNTQPNTITGGQGPVNQTQPPQFTLQEQQPSQPSQHGNFQPNQQAAQPQLPSQQGQVLQPQAAQPQVPNQQGQVLQPQAAQPQVPNQQGQQPQETEQSLQQAAYSYFKTQNNFQSFWNALPQGIADNPIVQPLGPSKQKWVRLKKLLGYVQALQGVQYDPNDVLRTFVDAGIWDVSNEGFNLLVFKDDHIWNGIPSVLLEEIKQYRDSGQMTWTSSEYDTTVGLITTVFQGTIF